MVLCQPLMPACARCCRHTVGTAIARSEAPEARLSGLLNPWQNARPDDGRRRRSGIRVLQLIPGGADWQRPAVWA